MQRDRQLDDAEARAEMAAGDGNGADGFLSQFVGELNQLLARQRTEIGRVGDRVEQGRIGPMHGAPPGRAPWAPGFHGAVWRAN